MKISFTVQMNDKIHQIEHEELIAYAKDIGLTELAPNRYSSLFVLNLLVLELSGSTTPDAVIREIQALEGAGEQTQTKQESEFKGPHLKGLWHKHFFFPHPSVLATNIMNQLAGGRLENLVKSVLDPSKSPTITAEMIGELSHRVVHESLENRIEKNKLTGEWIVYATHGGQNYYLCISAHESGDENIANNIRISCLPEFEFLKEYF